jgi:hypothetical protein
MSGKGKKQPAAETYTSDDMYAIIHQFATHITDTYKLSSKRFGADLPRISPETLVLVWQQEMEHTVVEQ